MIPWGQVARWLGWVALGAIFADWGMIICLLIGWFVPGATGEFFRADRVLPFFILVTIIVFLFAGLLGPVVRLYRKAIIHTSGVYRNVFVLGVGAWFLALAALVGGGWYGLFTRTDAVAGNLLAMLLYFVVTFVDRLVAGYRNIELRNDPLYFTGDQRAATLFVAQAGVWFFSFIAAVACLIFAEHPLPVPQGALPPGQLPAVHALGVMMFAVLGTGHWLLRRLETRCASDPPADAAIQD